MTGINKATLTADIFNTIRDQVSSQVTSVVDSASVTHTVQSVFSTFPYKQIGSISNYPIIVVEYPRVIEWTKLTMKKSFSVVEVKITAYSTRKDVAEKLYDSIVNTVETYRNTLKLQTNNLRFMNLIDTDFDDADYSGKIVHSKGATFRFKYSFTET